MWFRIDDKFGNHPKVRRLGKDRLAAVGLWTLCGVWCADNVTISTLDGFIPAEVVRQNDPRLRLAKRLVEVGLWVETAHEGEVGYQFHQWKERQPTRDEVQEKRAKTAKKVRDWRAKQAAQRTSVPSEQPDDDETCNPVTSEVTNQAGNPAPEPVPEPISTSPNGEVPPSLRSGGPGGEPKKKPAATTIPDGFTVTQDMVMWARQEAPLVDGRRETAAFVDHWRQATRNHRKRDWPAAWRNWMRRAQSDAESRQHRTPRTVGGQRSTTSERVAEWDSFVPCPEPALPATGTEGLPLIYPVPNPPRALPRGETR